MLTFKREYIYLDYNATTPVLPEVGETFRVYAEEFFYNPSSAHALGKLAKEALDSAREKVASLIQAKKDEIIWTSSGTESNHLAILGYLRSYELKTGKKGHLIVSSFEHPSILNLAVKLMEWGYSIDFLRVSPEGYVEVEDLKRKIRKDTALVSVMLANNEIGTIQPISELAKVCKEYGVVFHTDASQAVGKIPVSVVELSCDMLTISGHKLYAPKGIGALFVREGLELQPIFYGGGQERGLRPGTEPVALCMALAKACEIAGRDLTGEMERLTFLREKLYQGLKSAYPKLYRFGLEDRTLPNTLTVSFVGVSAQAIFQAIPQVCASTGAACHDRKGSITLSALKVTEDVAIGTIRFSLGRYTTLEDIERTIELFKGYFSKHN
jgi:cysteine desulfurase